MMIELTTGTSDSAAVVDAADTLAALIGSWDTAVTIGRPTPPPASSDKAIDPISVAALVLSVPSALLAVIDIADRISKRRRAKQLVEQAQTIRDTTDVRVHVVVGGTRRPLDEVDPDDLLEEATRP